MPNRLAWVAAACFAMGCSGSTATGGSASTGGSTAGSSASTAAATSGANASSTGAGTGSGSSAASTSSGTTAGASTGGSTGGTGSSGSRGTCASTREFSACVDASECDCGELCIADPAFSNNGYDTVCERPCTSSHDCPNAASVCTSGIAPGGSVCAVNRCTGSSQDFGSACSAPDGGGTCIMQSASVSYWAICMPNGTAQSCNVNSDENPHYSADHGSQIPADFAVANPQPRGASHFCGAGKACFDPHDGGAGTCETVCNPGQVPSPCASGKVCVSQGYSDPTWGFCQACKANGSRCDLDTDCCAGLCNGSTFICGQCENAGLQCARNSDCCSGRCGSNSLCN